ncbi:hypothetical protein [Paludisphaera borealis]|uniref:Uncharacterized protein n=1 Tax=Paludisphaera borealis TaxID=1387353 RepID=A0A1U7CPH5_9BACT|nr:hypothetical protein [Paludisphaera borealis]APW60821.1 hypothetical protein BSF38_02312 [Paludisphaera borealis]
MNRRTALLLTTLLGAFSPASLLGQEAKRRAPKTRSRQDRGFQPASSTSALQAEEPPIRDDPDAEPASEDPPVGFSNEPGFQWKRFSIGRYTRVAQNQQNPQKAIIDWIFRRTGANDWHGEKTAVLCASKTELRAYNSPEILKQVDEVVERFTGATEDVLSIHVQFIAAVDTRWRHTVFSRLTSVGSGPQGQQIWMMRVEDAALVLSQMQVQQGFRKLADQRVDMVNGQTLTIKTAEPRTFSGGIQRESAAGTGFQPKADKLEESIVLRLSPLLTFEGDGVDAAIDLTVNSVQSFQRTKIIAPREIGPSEMSIDVPISYQTHLDQTVKNWPLGQTLLLSGGIHPGIIDKKGGWLGTPLGAPSSTEVLVFLDAETVSRAKTRSRNTDVTAARSADDNSNDEEEEQPAPRPKARKTTRRATRGPDLDTEPEAN